MSSLYLMNTCHHVMYILLMLLVVSTYLFKKNVYSRIMIIIDMLYTVVICIHVIYYVMCHVCEALVEFFVQEVKNTQILNLKRHLHRHNHDNIVHVHGR